MTIATILTYILVSALIYILLGLIGYMIDTHRPKTINPPHDPREKANQRAEKLQAFKKTKPELKASKTPNGLTLVEVTIS